MPIIGTLPNNIANGAAVDANPVMADFNFIVNQVNANANPTGTLTAPSGTRTVFQQASAPLGWVTDASINDHTLWVTGSTGTTGGSQGYSLMFGSGGWTSDAHTLVVGEMPSHSHTDSGHAHASPPHAHAELSGSSFVNTLSGAALYSAGGNTLGGNTTTALTAATINTGFANLQNTGGGGGHTHTKTFDAKFAQCLVAAKS